MSRYSFDGRTAVVTGAGSGIGRALSLALAERGASVALVERDGERLDAVRGELGGTIHSAHELDVTDRDGVATLPDRVLARHTGVDLVFNNAGVAVDGTFDAISEADFDWLMDVNFNAVVRVTRAFLPHLRRSDDAVIANVSSIFGIIAPPRQSAYSAAKFAVRGFSMALAHELDGTNVHVAVVHPGGVDTRIALDSRMPDGTTEAERTRRLALARKLLRMPPSRAASIILDGIERRRRRIVVGRDAMAGQRLERLLPTGYIRVLRRLGMGP